MKKVAAVLLSGTIVFSAALARSQQPGGATNTPSSPVQIFTPGALESLVAGIAFYPDSAIELALDAAQNPPAIEAAAHSQAGSFQQSVVQLQQQYPALLVQLGQQLAATTQLGIAARSQLNDVWAAIDRVRQQGAARATYPATYGANSPTSAPATTAVPATTAAPAAGAGYPATSSAAGAFIAGALAGQAMQQPAGIYYGPGAAGGVYAPAVNNGAINSGAVNNGAVGAAAIHANNTTQTGSGNNYSNAAAAAAVNNNNSNNNANHAAGAHHAANSNPRKTNGTASFSRSAATRTSSSRGVTPTNRATDSTTTHAGNNRDSTTGRSQSPARGQSSAGHAPTTGGRGGRGR